MANEEQLSILKQGAEVWNKWRIRNPGAHVMFREANLSKLNLLGIDLSKADLRKTDLTGTNLARADLREANLIEADLSKANLSEANLRGAKIVDVRALEEGPRGSLLGDTELKRASLNRANLSEANLGGVNIRGADLTGANLRGTNLREADLQEAKLNGANLQGANLRRANLSGANLRKADLTNADLRQANLRDADLYKAQLAGANLSRADLTGANIIKRSRRPRAHEYKVAENEAHFGLPPIKSSIDEVYFRGFFPRDGKVETWHTLLVYTHLMSTIEDVRKDVQRFKDQLPTSKEIASPEGTRIVRGTEITIIPSCEGLVFNPERVVFKWIESYHRADFRFWAEKSLSNDAARVQINIYVGPLIVGTLKLAVLINETDPQIAAEREVHKRMYRQEDIFVSYSHKDTPVVLALKKVYDVLGFNTLRDIDTLRAGQVWNEELMSLIDRARIFQLFWSQNSARSKYCRQEWEHALKRNKEGFIRPVYWEIPMPKPPRKLSMFHFAFLEKGGLDPLYKE